jgi:hypothetical protein
MANDLSFYSEIAFTNKYITIGRTFTCQVARLLTQRLVISLL